MRAWALIGAIGLLGCGSSFSDRADGAAGHAGRINSTGSSGKAAGAAGTAGASIANIGGSAGSGGSIGGSPSAGQSDGGRSSVVAGEGGVPDGIAGHAQSAEGGAAGSIDESGGAIGDAGKSASGGKAGHHSGGSGGSPSTCACDAAHDCVNNVCVPKPECDCKALHVECSLLSKALAEAFDCPVDVDCGSCPSGELCTVPYSDSADLSFERTCMAPAAWSDPPQGCTDASLINSEYGSEPSCPQISGCSVPYAFCDSIQGIVKPSSGENCPAPATGTSPMPNAYCGPAL